MNSSKKGQTYNGIDIYNSGTYSSHNNNGAVNNNLWNLCYDSRREWTYTDQSISAKVYLSDTM